MRYQISGALLEETFNVLRTCGGGRRECQVLWTSEWDTPAIISEVVHPHHSGHYGGFDLDSEWITRFWLELAERGRGVRVQVHTHPGKAGHSATDDAFPIVHAVGFLSLVIPDFGLGPAGLDRTYLAEMGPSGRWRQLAPDARLEISS